MLEKNERFSQDTKPFNSHNDQDRISPYNIHYQAEK